MKTLYVRISNDFVINETHLIMTDGKNIEEDIKLYMGDEASGDYITENDEYEIEKVVG